MATSNKLSDKTVKAALKVAQKSGMSRKLSDGNGLVLDVRPTGSGWWRWRYWIDGREGMLSLGVYPDVNIAEARLRRDDARKLIAAGKDPSELRKVEKKVSAKKAENARLALAGLPGIGTFEFVARDWYAKRESDWAATYSKKIIRRLEAKVFPYIGTRPIAEIQPPELLDVLRRCESDGIVETAHRVRDTCSEVFMYAIAEGSATTNPARDLARALSKHTTKHIASVTDPKRFGELLRAIDGYQGTPIVKAALSLAALVFLRPGAELRHACWREFDLDAGTWEVPSERMKREKDGKANGPDHIVPLSSQAVKVLRELHPLTKHNPLVFQGVRQKDKPISENTLNAALDSLGFTSAEHRAHGFRASARTMLAERLNFPPEVIEAQLAHSVPDALGRAYNRTQFLKQRQSMMQAWGDYLDKLRAGNVIQLKTA